LKQIFKKLYNINEIMRIIDLSKTIQYNPDDPFFMKVKIKYKSHKSSKWLIRFFLGLPSRLFPKNFLGWADDEIRKMGVHSTTHIDAPWHYAPTCERKPAKTIDQIPLEWCFGKGIVIDMKHKEDFDAITSKDIISFLEKENLSLEPNMIVLIKTGRDKHMGTKDFFEKGTGMSAEATEYLVGVDQEYCHMEQLTNLDALPTSGFQVAAFPLKIKGGSAAPARVVAILE